MNKYAVIIYWSEEDGVFVAEAPSLPGCAAHGDTHEEALGNIRDAIGRWVDTAAEFGEPVPTPGQRSSFGGRDLAADERG